MHKQKTDTRDLQPGLTAQGIIMVSTQDCAAQWGNDGLLVFSTPAMLGYMERTCVQALQPYLAENMMSVGTAVSLRHLAPTPVLTGITISVVLIEMAGKRLTFQFEVRDPWEQVGEGTHERYLANKEKFLAKVRDKQRE